MRTDSHSDLDLHTRRSLLSRLRNLDDGESWRVFFELYWRMLFRVACRAGLNEVDAQDVVQETVVAVARQMPQFRYDPSRGTFKHWLFRIVRRRVADHLRRLYRQPPRTELAMDPQSEDDDAAESLAADGDGAINTAWDQEWEQSVYDAAVETVRGQTNPRHFQVFDCCVRLGWPASKVASTLGMNTAQVYLARHRVSQAVKKAARTINDERVLRGFDGSPPATPAGEG